MRNVILVLIAAAVFWGWTTIKERKLQEERFQSSLEAQQKAEQEEAKARNTKYAPWNAACKKGILAAVSYPNTVEFREIPHIFDSTENGANKGYFAFIADYGDGLRLHAAFCYLDKSGNVIDIRNADR